MLDSLIRDYINKADIIFVLNKGNFSTVRIIYYDRNYNIKLLQ